MSVIEEMLAWYLKDKSRKGLIPKGKMLAHKKRYGGWSAIWQHGKEEQEIFIENDDLIVWIYAIKRNK